MVGTAATADDEEELEEERRTNRQTNDDEGEERKKKKTKRRRPPQRSPWLRGARCHNVPILPQDRAYDLRPRGRERLPHQPILRDSTPESRLAYVRRIRDARGLLHL